MNILVTVLYSLVGFLCKYVFYTSLFEACDLSEVDDSIFRLFLVNEHLLVVHVYFYCTKLVKLLMSIHCKICINGH